MKFFKFIAKLAVVFLIIGTIVNLYKRKTKSEYITFEDGNDLDLY